MTLVSKMLSDLEARASINKPLATGKNSADSHSVARPAARSYQLIFRRTAYVTLIILAIAGWQWTRPDAAPATKTAVYSAPPGKHPTESRPAITDEPAAVNIDKSITVSLAATHRDSGVASDDPLPLNRPETPVRSDRPQPARQASTAVKIQVRNPMLAQKTRHIDPAPELEENNRLTSKAKLLPRPQQPRVKKTVVKIAPEQIADHQYRVALQFIRNKQPAQAVARLRMALASDPDHQQARLALIEGLVQERQLDEAEKIALDGIALAHSQIPFILELAKIYLEQGDTEHARTLLARQVNLPANNANYFGLLAVAYQRTEQHTQALRFFERAIQLEPNETRWWLGFAISLEKSNNTSHAVKAYRHVINAPGTDAKITQWVRSRLAALRPAKQQDETQASVSNRKRGARSNAGAAL